MILLAKSHIIRKMSIGTMLISVCRKTSCLFKNRVSSIACSAGFASLQGQLFVTLHDATTQKTDEAVTHRQQTTTIAETQSQPSIHSLSHEEGVWGFGKDANIERPKVLQGRKAHKAFL